MANEFYVAPFGGIDVGARVENILTGARQRKKEMDWEKEAPEIIQSKDPDRIADLMIRYPEMQPQITTAMGVKRPETMNKITSVAQKGLVEGGDPKEYLAEVYKTAINNGETDFANKVQGVLEKEFETPGYASGFFQRVVASNAPEEWNKIKGLMPKPEKPSVPYTDIGKINADLKAGLITEEQAREARTKRVDKEKYAPSNLKKLIDERSDFLEQGLTEDHPVIKAYDQKITGMDVDIEKMTPEEIDMWGSWVNLTGKTPSVGRGKQATAIRVAILKSAARQSLGADEAGVPEDPTRTPAEAALDVVATTADTKAMQGSLNFLDKQLSSMGSFVTNLESQVGKVEDLSKDLETFNTRLLNVPLRTLRSKLLGSPLQAKYDMYLTEIESEIGKLATGSTASIAELSVSAQDKWHKIHDKNLSVKDMLELLKETKNAARFRLESVDKQLQKTRERLRTRAVPGQQVSGALPEGATLIGTSGGKNVYRTPDGRQFIEE